MASNDRGPLAPIDPDELVWLRPGQRFDDLVKSDLHDLDGVETVLLRASRDLVNASSTAHDDGMSGLIAEMSWQLGDLDGILHTGQLDQAGRGLDEFRSDLDDRGDTLDR